MKHVYIFHGAKSTIVQFVRNNGSNKKYISPDAKNLDKIALVASNHSLYRISLMYSGGSSPAIAIHAIE